MFRLKDTLKMEAFLPFCLLAFMTAARFLSIVLTQDIHTVQYQFISINSVDSMVGFFMETAVAELLKVSVRSLCMMK